MNFQKSIGFTPDGFFQIYETIVRRCGHFQNFKISDPKSQKFQNVQKSFLDGFGKNCFRSICIFSTLNDWLYIVAKHRDCKFTTSDPLLYKYLVIKLKCIS